VWGCAIWERIGVSNVAGQHEECQRNQHDVGHAQGQNEEAPQA
jgi:hypothetical protein